MTTTDRPRAWTERTVDLDGPVRLVDYGGDPAVGTVLCVHGLGGWALDWQLLAPRLRRYGHVVAVDLPGFGRSPTAGRPATVRAHQRLLDGYLRTLGDAPLLLVGNSMGATISLLQAAARPSSVARLVLLSPVLPASVSRLPHPAIVAQFGLYAMPQLGETFLRLRRSYLSPRDLVDGSLRFISSRSDHIPAVVFEQRYELVERLSDETDAAFLEAARSLLTLLAYPGAYRRVIERVTAPALVLHGEDDPLVNPASAVRLGEDRPDWSIRLLEGVGHVPMLEVPGDVADAIDRWMAADATDEDPTADGRAAGDVDGSSAHGPAATDAAGRPDGGAPIDGG